MWWSRSDQLLLDITGDNLANYKLNVSPEGYINAEYVGRIQVGSLTIEQATNKIIRSSWRVPILLWNRVDPKISLKLREISEASK